MKKTAFFAGIFLMFFSAVNAQDSSATTAPENTQTMAQPETKAIALCPTADSIAAKYKLLPMPEPMAIEQVFPALGEYQATAASSTEAAPTTDANANAASTESDNTEMAPASNVKVTLDDQNKGIVWIEGLPQGKIKALLRKSPATYKIPAQQTEDGKEVKEGTLIYDQDTKALSLSIGKKYNDEDPAAAFAPAATEEQSMATEEAPKAKSAKGKKASKKVVKEEKPYVFVGTKVEQAASTPAVSQ